MKRLAFRRKSKAYTYFNGIDMQLTIDTGKEEDIKRFEIGNYFDAFDTKNARAMHSFILSVFKETI